MPRFFQLCFFSVALAALAQAEIHLPSVLAEHMVLQRGMPVRIWGSASANEAVTVTFRGESATTAVDDIGRWQVNLKPSAAGGPFPLEIRGTNRILFSDVLVGDIWLASGQSNMEFPVKNVIHAESELARASHPQIRLFHVAQTAADYPRGDAPAKTWAQCDRESVNGFSAVAYFFAVDLQKTQQVPIGMIEADWGGTPVESWTSLRALAADASLMPVFAARAESAERQAATVLTWKKEDSAKQQRPWHPDFAAWGPGALYNGMIAPLIPYRIKGVLWYQGESNAGVDRVGTYRRQFETMIRDWRERWGESEMPFYFVQLANFITNAKWPELREAQRETLELVNTGMAVAIDIGDPSDIHPKNKQEVGRRLALIARARSYGENIEYSGPVFREAARDGSQLRLWFDHASGLEGTKGFEIAGADRKFVPATARIEGETVVLSSDAVPVPLHARYAWANNPECDFRNSAALPASSFTGSSSAH